MKKEENYVKYFFILLILLVLIIFGVLTMKSGRLLFLFEGIGLSLGVSVTWLYWKKKH
ncbi:hypothetical protein MK549_09080 [Streptococcus gallolyticus subsp. gallolyticus]|uniref:hypothetical protein n=1 Tax=Streptococcus gallolyticus TaxID=315405 RepID=UPI0001E0A002|nr:hypothetical protein [Streptococcus gallolyticus]MCF2566384.1 hypothetical protein [Streptococcus pasteurianus]EFM28583.1 hypothetical protein HMPREF9352_2141 [Streptococcus gallolyticus subsp. gallolyticus TX20005]KJE98843.1 membrane protein [Streptococcus gallolyticus subsp. gallolyticus]MCF1634513.1 hypothetical protein [Streptococcus gallolyticus]MCL4890161.1 hypothetical protein [Streptococcus gallolyticus]